LSHNVGKAEAFRQGTLHGLKDNPVLIGFLDADLATSIWMLFVPPFSFYFG
jgi:hypothetical protein